MKSKLIVVALFGCLLTSAQAAEHTARRMAKQLPSAPQPVAAVPRTLEQMPTVPPQVTYQGGQLSILARNSTLGEILKAVHAQTGAEIDMPGTGNDRVVGSFGPGPARDVLAALLYGSRFNYVLLGSETDLQALSRVMLFAKTATSETAPAESASAAYQGNNVAPAYQNMAHPLPGRPGMPAPNAANQQAADTGEEADAQAEDDSSDADDQADEQADDQSETTTVEGEEPGQVKTPQQMLQELQQQQQQQNQPGTQPGFPPGIRPGFPPGMQPGMPGGYPPGVTPPGGQQQQQ